MHMQFIVILKKCNASGICHSSHNYKKSPLFHTLC